MVSRKVKRFYNNENPPHGLTVKPFNEKDVEEIELRRQHFKENPPVLGVVAPVKTRVVTLNVAQMWEEGKLPGFQRDFQMKRMEVIIDSIRIFGLQDTIFRVIVNKDMEPLDGRHLTIACYILGIPTVKAVMMEFESLDQQILFFNHVNKAKMPMKTEHVLYSNYLANEPIACLMYKLALEDNNSKWQGNVAILDAPKPSHLMSITNFSKVLNWTGLQSRRVSEGDSRQRLLNKIETTDYNTIIERVNKFHDWYYVFAKKPREPNDLFHSSKVLVTMLNFFFFAHKQDQSCAYLEVDRILNSSIRVFKNNPKWNFENLLRLDYIPAIKEMVNHFNTTRDKYKMVIPEL